MKLKQKYNEVQYWINPTSVFYFLMLSGLVLSAFYTLFLHHNAWETIFFDRTNDKFMDFFNPLYYSYYFDPYGSWASIYPALPHLIYRGLGMLVFADYTPADSFALMDNFLAMLVFAIYNLVLVGGIAALLYKYIQGSRKKKLLTIGVILSAYPFLSMLERGNSILMALLALLFYMVFKDSKNKILKELAFISLGISAAIKIYPAIFGLLLLKEKRFMEAIRTGVYGVLAFVVPFLFMGGIGNIGVMINNITSFSGQISSDVWGYGYKINVANTLTFIVNSAGLPVSSTMITYFTYAMLALSLVSFFLIKSKWKATLLLSAIMIAIPGISFIYTLNYLIIPLVLFLNTRPKGTLANYIYSLSFVMAMGIAVFFNWGSSWGFGSVVHVYEDDYSLRIFLTGLAVLLFFTLPNFDGLKMALKRIAGKVRG